MYSFVSVRVNNNYYYPSMNIIIEAFIRERCRFNWAIVHGRRLFKGVAFQGNTTCDINTKMIKREMVIMIWFHFKNDSDCVIIYPNFVLMITIATELILKSYCPPPSIHNVFSVDLLYSIRYVQKGSVSC